MKILLLENNVTDLVTLTNGIALAKQWCSTINLPLDFTLQSTAIQFKSIPFSNNVASGYTVDPIQVFQTGKTFGDYDVYLLVYDWTKITPQPTNPSDGGRGMSIPTQWYTTFPEVFAEFFLHELCHYYFALTGKTDVTHLYPPEFAQKLRKDYYLYLLKQFVPQTPTVTLTRGVDNGTEILGELRTSDGQFGCVTLERPWKNNQSNISAIPKGTYTCQWKFKFNSLAYHYQVMNVPGRTGIFIHPGNYFFNSVGCILLGSAPSDLNHDGQLDVLNSQAITKAFETKMGKSPFTLVIC